MADDPKLKPCAARDLQPLKNFNPRVVYCHGQEIITSLLWCDGSLDGAIARVSGFKIEKVGNTEPEAIMRACGHCENRRHGEDKTDDR